MPVKRYKLPVSKFTRKVRKATALLKTLPRAKKLDLLVAAGAMTEDQAARAKSRPPVAVK